MGEAIRLPIQKRFVYSLSDPETGNVRYIGVTADTQRRYKDHCANFPEKSDKFNWIEELKSKGFLPVISVIEECDHFNASWRESYHIIEHLKKGCRPSDYIPKYAKTNSDFYTKEFI